MVSDVSDRVVSFPRSAWQRKQPTLCVLCVTQYGDAILWERAWGAERFGLCTPEWHARKDGDDEEHIVILSMTNNRLGYRGSLAR